MCIRDRYDPSQHGGGGKKKAKVSKAKAPPPDKMTAVREFFAKAIRTPSDTMDEAALRKERNELIKIARKAGLAPRTRGAGSSSTAVPDVDMDEDDEVYQAKPATDDDSDDSD